MKMRIRSWPDNCIEPGQTVGHADWHDSMLVVNQKLFSFN